MIKIIRKKSFKKIPWKNGKGSTLELAINEGGSLADFDWRLSIATVDEDGAFSDFAGYNRNLVLIEGNGIVLHHNEQQVDRLEKLLTFSTFDGASKTTAELISGPITDFNLMTKTESFSGSVETYRGIHQVTIRNSQLCFIYGLSTSLEIYSTNHSAHRQVASGDLVQLLSDGESGYSVAGQDLIIVYINRR
ncbi:HutD/Ves family protein [Aliikangiella coralliicola]|uniref:HutD family protein n=1 Tax=Aliikangiella coralliicola TaxID=2592383 RepID=A0A545UDQ8_9GAMM|nr:HutD family protein [Aliikangiella coralliicola]TQV87604.1 HutD family protein [Aliikangiella coralliicola]